MANKITNRQNRLIVKRPLKGPGLKLDLRYDDGVDDLGNNHLKRCPYGNAIAEIDGKRFYNSISIDGVVISVDDSVDILRNYKHDKNIRETNLAKIAALYTNELGHLMAEVAFYFDSGEKIPFTKNYYKQNYNTNQWNGFSHNNEVVAFNKFEEVEVESFDEKVTVHSSLKDYEHEIATDGDEELNVFCRFICYSENYAILPFDISTQWKKVMVDYSKYHRLYHPEIVYERDGIDEDSIPPELDCFSEDKDRPIIGRDEEADKIRTFIETGINQGGTGQILYISGVPGTGKTETVRMITRELIDKKLKGHLPWFDLIEINAVHLSKPKELYRVFYMKLFGKHAPNAYKSYEALDRYFSNNNTPCVMVVDEVDYIVTKTQKVLFTLFDLPSKKNSKFILIIISNTMDLPSKMKSSCVSRLGFGSLVFKSYRYQQIMDVIKHKLGSFSSIDPIALQLCARRVTNYCGDMRKALQICKLAIKEANGRIITTSDMSRITNMVLNSAVVDALQYVSTGIKCLLVAIVLVLRELELSIAPAIMVYNTFSGMITVLKPELEGSVCKDSFKHLLITSVNNGIIALEPTVFPSYTCITERMKQNKIFESINEDLGDTGIVILIDIGHLVSALAKDPYWEQKLQNVA